METSEFNACLIKLKEGLEYYAYSLTNNRDDAKDLVQDTFLKALIYRDKFEDNTNLKAWTYTIMRNTFINNYRRSMKSATIIDQTEDAYYLNTSTKSSYGMPEAELSVKELKEAIGNISDEQRIPFEMQYKGYKYKEIAKELNLSIGTVKSRIFFCRKKLINRLKEYSE
ncbi:MAG: RNA polymerase sigma factor [Bacteroidales bacterium]|jgi:RNA polymerase sigma-70 factor (ECF subfamily)|nr:RNA polymerase sigma factor [Bacteroidales bacterium]MBR5832013.1 RNA polymerase sigma factor [Bacteroidales bacterium]